MHSLHRLNLIVELSKLWTYITEVYLSQAAVHVSLQESKYV